jgi:hypothetical protein
MLPYLIYPIYFTLYNYPMSRHKPSNLPYLIYPIYFTLSILPYLITPCPGINLQITPCLGINLQIYPIYFTPSN